MSDFDPYYKWLGIPPDEQPPTHYRLLGIQVLERNVEVIESAANRQMAYLQELSGGDEHIDEAQRLLGEVAKARVCLLNTESKARYDAEIAASLDSLPEAEEATGTGDKADAVEKPSAEAEPAAEPPEMKRGGRPRRSSSGGSARKTSAGRPRAGRTQKSGSSGSSKSKGGSKKKASNDLAIKIGALAGTAAFVFVVGILLLGGGGDGGGKKSKTKTALKANTPSRPVASKTGAPAPVSSEAEKKKTDSDFDRQLARFENENPNPPKPKPPKSETPKAPETNATPSGAASSNIVADTDGVTDTDATETDASELSDAEQAEALLESRGLEERFNSVWEHTALMAAYEQEKNNTGSKQGSAEFEELLRQRIQQRQNELMRRVQTLMQKGTTQGGLSSADLNEYNRGIGLLKGRGVPITGADEIAAIPFVEEEARIRQSLAAERPNRESRGASTVSTTSDVDSAVINLANALASTYATLQGDAEVQAALKTVGGTLADAPEISDRENPATANNTQAPTSPTTASLDNSESREQPKESNQAASEPAGNVNGEENADDKPEESTVSFDALKEQLTALEKETKKTLGGFNKKAKAYISNKKNLVKRIKAGEAVYAKRGRQQDAIQYPEEKTKFGEETEAKVVKPLNALKAQLKNLAKPDMAPLEEKLQQAEKMIEQLKATSKYSENPKSVDSLAALIAKYRKGFEVQQTKMAK